MCSSPHWQVGSSWFSRKIVSSEQEQRLSRWADFAKNCLPRIECKELPRFREKISRSWASRLQNSRNRWAKKWGPTCERDISNSAIYTTAIYRAYTVQWNLFKAITRFYGLSRQVVFQHRENKHDSIKTVPDKLQNLCVFNKTSLVSLYRFHCISNWWLLSVSLVKLPSDDCFWTLLMISQHWIRLWLGTIITWTMLTKFYNAIWCL